MSFCERCGKPSRALTLCSIESARMFVCPDCARFGKPVPHETRPTPPPVPTQRPAHASPKKDALASREVELADDYPKRIQRARERKGLTREDLGRRINEKVSIISKLETGQLHPSDELVKKLERALEIVLLEPVERIDPSASPGSTGMTLGDFITRKNR